MAGVLFSRYMTADVQHIIAQCVLSPVVALSLSGLIFFVMILQDAIDTAAESGDTPLAEELLSFFVNIGDKECFCAALYTCYSLIRPDVAMELAWRNK